MPELTARVPPVCDYGHVLRIGGRAGAPFISGRIENSFVLCGCAPAVAKPGAAGHVQTVCTGCRREGRVSAWRDPPCDAASLSP